MKQSIFPFYDFESGIYDAKKYTLKTDEGWTKYSSFDWMYRSVHNKDPKSFLTFTSIITYTIIEHLFLSFSVAVA